MYIHLSRNLTSQLNPTEQVSKSLVVGHMQQSQRLQMKYLVTILLEKFPVNQHSQIKFSLS